MANTRNYVPSLVENFNPVSAKQMAKGLGFNITGSHDLEWNFQKMKECGATEIRLELGWGSVEDYDNPGTYRIGAKEKQALEWCKKYDFEPLLLASYGSPYRVIKTLTVKEVVATDVYTIKVNESVSGITPIRCHAKGGTSNNINFAKLSSYYGALITEIDEVNNTITLASATKQQLEVGFIIKINQLLYPSINSTDPNDPSAVAFCNYCMYLASLIEEYGLRGGRVNVWNEPVWANDFWDIRPYFYDDRTKAGFASTDYSQLSPDHKGILENLSKRTLPKGVSFNSGSTDKTGNGTYLQYFPTREQVKNIQYQSFHPYGNNPEDHGWYPDNYQPLPGSNTNSNLKQAMTEEIMHLKALGFTVIPTITETGCDHADDAAQTRHIMRQYLYYHSAGIERINYYTFANTNGNYPWVWKSSKTERNSFIAMRNFMSEINRINGNSISHAVDYVPEVIGYNGSFPLATIPVMGKGSSCIFTTYIRDYYTDWFNTSIAMEIKETIKVKIPEGTTIFRLWNLNDGLDVPYSLEDNVLTYEVTTDPIALKVNLQIPLVKQVESVTKISEPLPKGGLYYPLAWDTFSTDKTSAVKFRDWNFKTMYPNKKETDYIFNDNEMYRKFMPNAKVDFMGAVMDPNGVGMGYWTKIPEDAPGGGYQFEIDHVNRTDGFINTIDRAFKMTGLRVSDNVRIFTNAVNDTGVVPLRGGWNHVFYSWGSNGNRIYLNGKLVGYSNDPTKLRAFSEPIIHSSESKLLTQIALSKTTIIPFQPTDEQVARWSARDHEWESPAAPAMSFSLDAGKEWISPYYFNLKKIYASSQIVFSNPVTINIRKINSDNTFTSLGNVTFPVDSYFSEINLSSPIFISKGDRIALYPNYEMSFTISGD